MVNVKKKGNQWENKLANWLRDHGIKAWKDGASGGGNREKGDVGNNLNMTIESKACKTIKLMDWWRQVNKSANMHHNQPVLFIHQDGMPDNEWIVCMHSEDWVEMVKDTSNSPKTAPNSDFGDRNKRYLIDKAVTALKAVIKVLED